MVTTKTQKEIMEKISSILDRENRPLSIRELKIELEKQGITKSPQLIKKYLKLMEDQGLLEEQ
jgi:repressor of nif and glnA expression